MNWKKAFLIFLAGITFSVVIVYFNGNLIFYSIQNLPSRFCEFEFSFCRLNVTDNHDNSPLYLCVHNGRIDLSRYLLTHTDKPLLMKWVANKNDQGRTILQSADCLPTEILEKLIDLGASVNADPKTGYTPLQNFVTHPEMLCPSVIANVRLLLSKGADPKVRNPLTGETALHLLVEKSANIKYIELLTNAGLSVNEKNNDGVTPLWSATLYQAGGCPHVSVVRWLLKQGADPKVVPTGGLYRGMCLTDAIRKVLRDEDQYIGPIDERCRHAWSKTLSILEENVKSR